MRLEFKLKREYGRDRYYPQNAEARALVDLTGRKCFKDVELQRLQYAGFTVQIEEVENVERETDRRD